MCAYLRCKATSYCPGDTAESPSRREESGAAIAEAVFVIPLLLLLIVGVTQVGWLLINHQKGAGVLAESLRFASAVPGLAPDLHAPGAAALIEARTARLLTEHGMSGSSSWSIQNDGGRTIITGRITVNVRQLPLPRLFTSDEITVAGQAPYLYPQRG